MERDPLVAQLTDVMRTALEDWVRSLSVEELRAILLADNDAVMVTPESILVFDKDRPQLDIEMSRLRKILKNLSDHSHDVRAYIEELHKEGGTPVGRSYASAVRKLATCGDSAWEMSRLLNGDDLDDGEEPDSGDLPDSFTVDSLTEEQKQRVHGLAEIVPHDPFAPVETDVLKLAQVHRQIREAVKDIPADHCTIDGRVLHARLGRILEYIRES